MTDFIVALGERRYRVIRPWGDLPAGLGKVTDVTTDSRDRVYGLTRRDPAVEPPGDCVHVFSPEGERLASFGRDRILDAHMIAADGQDRIWVVDRDSHEIVAFTPDGQEVATLGRRHRPLEPFNHPSDIAFAPDGTIWVADGYAGGQVHGFAADLTPLISFGSVGTGPGQFLAVHGIWAARDGRILVADRENSRVQVFDRRGTVLAIWSAFFRPSDIWEDAQGRFVISDAVPTLNLIGPDGATVGRARPVLNGAHGLWGDRAGRIYLAENNPSRITRLDPVDG